MGKIVQRVFGNSKLNMSLLGASALSIGLLTNNVIEKKSLIEEMKEEIVLSEKENNKLSSLNDSIKSEKEQLEINLSELNKISNEKDENIKTLKNVVNTLNEKVSKLESEKKTQQAQQQTASRGNSENVSAENWQTFRMSHYGADCRGCSGTTASGVNVKNSIYYNGMRIIASDPRIIPLGSIVEISENGGSSYKAIVLDTGGAIKGYKLDMLVSSEKESYNHGVKQVKLKIVRKGW